MLKYNELYKLVRENRDIDKGSFSIDYMEHWLEKNKRTRKRKRDSDVGQQTLKISDDLGELMGVLLDNNSHEATAHGGNIDIMPV